MDLTFEKGACNMDRCSICGKPITATDEYCPNCHNPLKSNGTSEVVHNEIRKQILAKSFVNVFIFGIIIAVIWEILSHFVPSGGGMLAVNIIGLILSLWIFLWPFYSYLRVTMPIWLSLLVSVLCWGVLFVGLRSLIGMFF